MRNSSQNKLPSKDQRQIKILITRIEEGLQMFDKGLERLRTKGKYYRLNEKKRTFRYFKRPNHLAT